jgi:putative transcriptional regulator
MTDFHINLRVLRKHSSIFQTALNSIISLVGAKIIEDAPAKPNAASPGRPGRKPKAQGSKTKTGTVKATKLAKAKKPASKKPGSKKPSFVAVLIKSMRNEAGLSQKALADKMGIAQNTVSLLESGRQKPKLDLAIKLGKALGTEHQKFLA